MKTKKTLSCYTFSNLLVGICCFNFLTCDNSLETVKVSNNELNTLRKIYEIKVETKQESISVTNNVYTVSVSKKDVSSKHIQYIKPSYNSVTGKNIVNYAKHYLGLKYVHAGNSLTTGTDCSGFTKLIYQEFGISLGRTVSSQTYSGQYVKKSDLQPGDLVFYGYTNYATHVGIYMGDGLVIHQSNPRDGVKINSVDMMVYITARRVIFEDVVSEVEEDNKSEVLEDSKDLTDNKEVTTDKEDIKTESKKEEVNKEELTDTTKDNNDSLEEKNEKEDKESLEVELEKEEVLDKTLEENEETQDNKEVTLDKVDSENKDISNEDEDLEKENEKLEINEEVEIKPTDTKIEVEEKLEEVFQEDSENN